MLQRMTLTCSNWRTVRRGTLVGFTDVTIVELRLILRDVAVHQRSATKRWVSLPCKPSIKNGAIARRPDASPIYTPLLSFANRRVGDGFSKAVVKAIAEAVPGAFGAARNDAGGRA